MSIIQVKPGRWRMRSGETQASYELGVRWPLASGGRTGRSCGIPRTRRTTSDVLTDPDGPSTMILAGVLGLQQQSEISGESLSSTRRGVPYHTSRGFFHARCGVNRPAAEASWRRSKDWSGRTENKTADTGDRAGSGAANHWPLPLSFSALRRGIIGGGMGS